jgi:hypothetical protein
MVIKVLLFIVVVLLLFIKNKLNGTESNENIASGIRFQKIILIIHITKLLNHTK